MYDNKSVYSLGYYNVGDSKHTMFPGVIAKRFYLILKLIQKHLETFCIHTSWLKKSVNNLIFFNYSTRKFV